MSNAYPASHPWEEPAVRWLRAAARFQARLHQAQEQHEHGGPRGGRRQWGPPGAARRDWGPGQWGRRRGADQAAPWFDWCDDPAEAGRQYSERGGHGRGPGRRGRGPGAGFGPGQGFGPPGGPGFGPGAGFGPGPGGFGPRGRRRGRGNVRAAILALLSEEPRHGYSIMTELAERSEGLWRPSPGSVYPVLQQLQDEGLVTSADSEGRRVFSLTEAGRSHVEQNADELREPWKVAEGGPQRRGRSLLEGMGALGAATFEVARLGSEEQTTAARVILDEARRAMYRLLAGDDDSDDLDGPRTGPVQDGPVQDTARVQDTPPGTSGGDS